MGTHTVYDNHHYFDNKHYNDYHYVYDDNHDFDCSVSCSGRKRRCDDGDDDNRAGGGDTGRACCGQCIFCTDIARARPVYKNVNIRVLFIFVD